MFGNLDAGGPDAVKEKQVGHSNEVDAKAFAALRADSVLSSLSVTSFGRSPKLVEAAARR